MDYDPLERNRPLSPDWGSRRAREAELREAEARSDLETLLGPEKPRPPRPRVTAPQRPGFAAPFPQKPSLPKFSEPTLPPGGDIAPDGGMTPSGDSLDSLIDEMRRNRDTDRLLPENWRGGTPRGASAERYASYADMPTRRSRYAFPGLALPEEPLPEPLRLPLPSEMALPPKAAMTPSWRETPARPTDLKQAIPQPGSKEPDWVAYEAATAFLSGEEPQPEARDERQEAAMPPPLDPMAGMLETPPPVPMAGGMEIVPPPMANMPVARPPQDAAMLPPQRPPFPAAVPQELPPQPQEAAFQAAVGQPIQNQIPFAEVYAPPASQAVVLEPEGAKGKKDNSSVRGIVANVAVGLMCLVMLVSTLVMAFGNKADRSFFGFYFFNVVSESMMPSAETEARGLKGGFQKNALLVVKKCKPEDLVKDDIITVRTRPGSEVPYLTHRFVRIDNSLGGTREEVIITRGDINNRDDDPNPIDSLVGKKVFAIPGLGKVMDIMKNSMLLVILLVFAAFLLAVFLMRYFRTRKEEKLLRQQNAAPPSVPTPLSPGYPPTVVPNPAYAGGYPPQNVPGQQNPGYPPVVVPEPGYPPAVVPEQQVPGYPYPGAAQYPGYPPLQEVAGS